MFENLHDPAPLSSDSSQFAAVTERAKRIRARRTAIGGSIATVAVVITGGIVIAINSGDAPDTVLTPAAPATDVVVVDPSTTTNSSATVPTTTLTPVPTLTVPAPTTTPAARVPEATTLVPGPTTTTAVPSTSVVPTTIAPFVTPERILVAVDAAGNALYFPSPAGAPIVLFDGPDPVAPTGDGPGLEVERVAVSPDESTAYISTCCEPVFGTMFKTSPPASVSFGDTQSVGYSPAIDPTGQLVAIAHYEGALTVERLDGAAIATSTPSNDGSESLSPWDVMWIDSNTIAMLGVVDLRFDVRFFVFDGTAIAPAGSVILGLFEPTVSYSFASTRPRTRLGASCTTRCLPRQPHAPDTNANQQPEPESARQE